VRYECRWTASTAEEQRWHAIGAAQIELAPSGSLFMRNGRIAMAKKSSASSQPAGLKSMRPEDIKNRKWTEGERQVLRSVAGRQAMDDSCSGLEEIPRLTDEQLANMVRLRDARPRKVAVSVRLDAQVLDWLRSKGEGHLTRINDILTNLMEAEHRARPGR
jgi:uncharacterized protein (DUF4415 family)